MWHFPLSPLSVAVTILFSISFSAEFSVVIFTSNLRIITTLNSAENEILNNIVIATERGDRGKCQIGFLSLTFQNPEEGGNKPPKCRFLNKKYSYNYLTFFFNFGPPHQNHPNYNFSWIVNKLGIISKNINTCYEGSSLG